MGTILKANFLKYVDSLAAQSQALATMLGDGSGAGGAGCGTGGATASDGAQNCIDELMINETDADVVEALLEAAQALLGKATTVPNAYTALEVLMIALNRHVAGINAYLTAQGERVAPEFKAALEMYTGERLDAANTFSPVVDPMDTCTITGVDAATWVDIADIDDDNYYASELVLKKTTAAAGANAITINLTCTKFDGTTEAKAVAVDASDAINTIDDIGTHPGDKYVGVTLSSIVCAGATAGEAWKVLSQLERVVAL